LTLSTYKFGGETSQKAALGKNEKKIITLEQILGKYNVRMTDG
jgi:hypothetical protein